MKGRVALLVGVVLFFVGVGVSVVWLRAAQVAAPASVNPAVSETPSVANQQPTVADDEARRARLAAAFAELQTARNELHKQLGDLKSVLWGREFPADQARSISKAMMSAQYLLKEPRLLGAFSETGEIEAEKNKVDAARVQLQDISGVLGDTAAK